MRHEMDNMWDAILSGYEIAVLSGYETIFLSWDNDHRWLDDGDLKLQILITKCEQLFDMILELNAKSFNKNNKTQQLR